MPTLLAAHTYRLAFPFGHDREAFDVEFPSGTSIKFQIGVYEDSVDGDFWDMSNVSTIRCEVKKYKQTQCRPFPGDPAYMQSDAVTLDANSITATGWANNTEQHATFNFAPSETALDPGDYWLSFSGFLNSGEFVSFGWGKINVVQDGAGLSSPVTPLDPSYYTAAQIDDWRQASGLAPNFNYYAKHFDSLPQEQPFSGSGTVLAYTLQGVTRYRHIPDPYDPIQDAFYANFSDPVLSNLIVRGNNTTV